MINIDFNIGARGAKAILLDGDDCMTVVAGDCLTRQRRNATPIAICRRDMRLGTVLLEAARAATFTASAARWRRLAPFTKEISQ